MFDRVVSRLVSEGVSAVLRLTVCTGREATCADGEGVGLMEPALDVHRRAVVEAQAVWRRQPHLQALRRYVAGERYSRIALRCGLFALWHSGLTSYPPLLFVHGNGDSAALWQTTLWRFESNGWPRGLLHAIDIPFPLARDDDEQAQPGRSSSADNRACVEAAVERILRGCDAAQMVLIANSRGGYAVRNYIQHAGGHRRVSHAVLAGVPNHGVWAIPGFFEGSEFAGTGPFLSALNASKNAVGDEVEGPVRWMTLRSDRNDKYAQPDGAWIGEPGEPTGVTWAGPELQGAANLVLPGVDHRETAFSPQAFDAMFAFITGHPPTARATKVEAEVSLSGTVMGLGLNPLEPDSGDFCNNLPLPGAHLAVYATEPTTGLRVAAPLLECCVGEGGRWGPLQVPNRTSLEFVVSATGYATTHIYRSAFPRSSALVHLQAQRGPASHQVEGSAVIMTRPRGYFDAARDRMQLDGTALPDLPRGAGVSSVNRHAHGGLRAIEALFNGERVVGQTWPAAEGHMVILELTF